jgi:hypothetical protein
MRPTHYPLCTHAAPTVLGRQADNSGTPNQYIVGMGVNRIGMIQLIEGLGITSHSHWNVTITKVTEATTSSTDPSFSTFISNGEIAFDSLDLTTLDRGTGALQRGAVHEFGHMLGYRDEYTNARNHNDWTSDERSIMCHGEEVRPRHYVLLAEWLNRQNRSIQWKVNGTVDLAGARL